jgi:hypothetical protein
MGKRSRGFGAVYRRPDERWEGQIRIPGGGRRSFYAKTRRDVIHRLSEARWALGQGLPVVQERRRWTHFWGAAVPGGKPSRAQHGPSLFGRWPAELVTPPQQRTAR